MRGMIVISRRYSSAAPSNCLNAGFGLAHCNRVGGYLDVEVDGLRRQGPNKTRLKALNGDK